MVIICGHVEEMITNNYVKKTRNKITQFFKKQHFQTSQKQQLVGIIHYFKTTTCDFNENGACGLGHFNSPQITPSLIPNLPSNIVHFVCGYRQSLFLDCQGNVYSVGDNYFGQLGLGHNTHQNILNKIQNIPSIQIISCVRSSCYLIDFGGNFWSFGFNQFGQLGQVDKSHKNAPKMLSTLKDVQQISYGSSGSHFFVGTGDTQSVSIPKEINSQYSTIWRDEFYTRAKSART